MLYVHTLVRIADNSGGYLGLCIRILGHNKKAVVGDAVVVAVKSILLNRKVTHNRRRKIARGMVKRAIVLRVAYQRPRRYNMFIKGSTNAVAILGNWGLPFANRAVGLSYYELKRSKYPKFATITEGVI